MILTLEDRYKAVRRLDAIERKALLEVEQYEDSISALIDGPSYGALDVDLRELRARRGKAWRRVTFIKECIVITSRGAH
jgi:hypothetical protein